MKMLKSLMMGLLLAGVLFTAPGCKAVEQFLVKRQTVELRPAQTNQVDVVSTNLAAVVEQKVETVVIKPAEQKPDGTFVPAVIDTRTVYATNFVPTLVTNRVEVVTPAVTYEERTLNPTAVQGAERVASMTGVPWLDTGVTALGGLGTIFFAWLNRRNKEKAVRLADGITEKESALKQAQVVGEVLVENFEELRKAALKVPGYVEHDAKVMRTVQQIQAAMGVKGKIAQIVEEKTDYTKAD